MCLILVVILLLVGGMICELLLSFLRYILYLLLCVGLWFVVIIIFVFVLRCCMVNVSIGVGRVCGSRIV